MIKKTLGIYDVLHHRGTHDPYNDNYSLEHNLEVFANQRFEAAILNGQAPVITESDLRKGFQYLYGNPNAYDTDATLNYMERLGVVGEADVNGTRPIISAEERKNTAILYERKYRRRLPRAPHPV